jgi:hypothetical protein
MSKEQSVITLINENSIPIPKERLDQFVKFFLHWETTYGVEVEKIVSMYHEAYQSQPEKSKDRSGKALRRTQSNLKDTSSTTAKPYLGYIIGIEHRENDLNQRQYERIVSQYNDLIDLGKAESVEINKEEYQQIMTEFNRLDKNSDPQARQFLKDQLAGRYVVVSIEDDEVVTENYLHDIYVWGSGNSNYGYGKPIRPDPSCQFFFMLLGDKPELITVNVKGRRYLDVLYKSKTFSPVLVTVVKNQTEGNAWFVDNNFKIEDVSLEDAFNGKDRKDVDKEMIKHLKTIIPKSMQVTVDQIDEYQRKAQSKNAKASYGIPVLVKGTVDDIYYRDNGTASISLINDSFDFDSFDAFADDEEDNVLRVSCNARSTKELDFDVDTVVYIYGQVYRGNAWDRANRQVMTDLEGNPVPASMPSLNTWGFITDPDLTNSKVASSPVSLSDYDLDEDEDDTLQSEDFDDFEIEGEE